MPFSLNKAFSAVKHSRRSSTSTSSPSSRRQSKVAPPSPTEASPAQNESPEKSLPEPELPITDVYYNARLDPKNFLEGMSVIQSI
jgi:hypothetical protein